MIKRCLLEERKDVLKRISAYIETKRTLDERLIKIPGGNLKIIHQLYDLFDEAVEDERKNLGL